MSMIKECVCVCVHTGMLDFYVNFFFKILMKQVLFFKKTVDVEFTACASSEFVRRLSVHFEDTTRWSQSQTFSN